MNDVVAILEGNRPLIWAFGLVFVRVGCVISLLPSMTENTNTARARVVLTAVVTAAALPAVYPQLAPLGAKGFFPFVSEVVAGLIIGATIRLIFIALQFAGLVIAQATSLSMLFGGVGSEPQPVVSNFLLIAGLALAVSSGLLTKIVLFVLMSYEVFPAGQLPDPALISASLLDEVRRSTQLAFLISVPFLIFSIISNVAFGFMNRAMPQLSVAFVGAPALTLAGIGLMVIVLPVGLGIWHSHLNALLDVPLQVAP